MVVAINLSSVGPTEANVDDDAVVTEVLIEFATGSLGVDSRNTESGDVRLAGPDALWDATARKPPVLNVLGCPLRRVDATPNAVHTSAVVVGRGGAAERSSAADVAIGDSVAVIGIQSPCLPASSD